MKKLFFAFALIGFFSTAMATHFTHGGMYYEYLKTESNGDLRYKVTLVLVRDCASSPVEFDDNVLFGIYTPASQGNYNLLKTVTVTKQKEGKIVPRGIGQVQGSSQFCFRNAEYQTEVVLKSDISDYKIVFQRCCRPTTQNLLELTNRGNTFYVTIDAKNHPFNNSSIFYNGAPIIFPAGVNYYGSLANFDKDGDSLAYRFVDAISGGSPDTPNPEPPTQISVPFAKVQYRSGFSGSKPTGTTPNDISLDSSNGNISIKGQTGKYLIAYEVEEWKNGVLVGKTYQEVMVYVIYIAPQYIRGIVLDAYVPITTEKRITLNWGAQIQESDSSFKLERSNKVNPAWQTIAVLDKSVFNYSDTQIGFDIVYYYRITGYNGTTAVTSNLDSAIIMAFNNTTGVAEPLSKNEIFVYPNPTREKIFIQNPAAYKLSEGYLLDAVGKQVAVIKENEFTAGVDVSALPQGIYYLKMMIDGRPFVEKVTRY